MWTSALGYAHPAWLGSFYPEDLPPEWMLTYYANEFAALLLPASEWRAPAIDSWLADTQPGFRFFLEWSPGDDLAAVVAVAQALGERCGGVVAPGPLALPSDLPLGCPLGVAGGTFPVARWPGALEPRPLRALIEQLGPTGLLVVEGEPPTLEVLRGARTVAELLGV